MAVYGSCSAAYAAEFGGFEVSTGTGEYEGTGEEWEDEPVCNTPEQNDSNTYVDEARNDGQESEQNTSGTVSSYNEEYEQVPVHSRFAGVAAAYVPAMEGLNFQMYANDSEVHRTPS